MTVFRILVPLAVSIFALYFSTRNVEWDKLKEIISHANISPMILALSISLITFWLRALRWKILLKPFQKISTLILARWQIGGLLINNFLPLRIGELARTYWAGHKSTLSKSTVLATIMCERILDIASIAFLSILLLFLTGYYKLMNLVMVQNILIAFSVLFIVILFFKFYLNRFNHLSFSSKLKNTLPEKWVLLFEKFISGLKIFKNGTELTKVIFISLVTWSVDIAIVMILSESLKLNLSWSQSGLTMAGLVLGVMVPAAPGAIGTYEAGGVAALMFMGFEKTVALSFVFFLHAFQYLFILMIGIPILMIEGFNPKKMLKNEKSSLT